MKHDSKTLECPNYDILTEGDLDDVEDPIIKQKLSGKANRNFEIGNLKHLPSVFFFGFLIIFSIITMKFMISSYNINKSDLYIQKFSLHYYSEFFFKQNTFLKLCTVASQFIFLLTFYFLFNLIKQRISVPELKHWKWKNYITWVLGIISIANVIGLTFYYDVFQKITKEKLKLVDNILFFVFLWTSFVFCLFTYNLLLVINGNGLQKDYFYVTIKKYLLALMLLQIILYTTSIFLVSFYKPVIELEKTLSSALIICMSVNSIIFVLCFLFFIWTLKYDLHYVTLNMQILPDIEYFLDLEENAKLEY